MEARNNLMKQLCFIYIFLFCLDILILKNLFQSVFLIKNLKRKMIDYIAKLCEISKDQINIKGKTTEKLGVIGKEKAIACEVICSVIKYD